MRMLVSQPPLPCRSADQRSKSNILRLLKGPIAGPKPSKPRPECPDVFSTRVPEAFNTHRQDGRGSGLVQDVLRSPARIPAAESRRRGLCAAPANVKRCTFSRVIFEPKIDQTRDCRCALNSFSDTAYREPFSEAGRLVYSFRDCNGVDAWGHSAGFDRLKTLRAHVPMSQGFSGVCSGAL
jgi:hypothetical protein